MDVRKFETLAISVRPKIMKVAIYFTRNEDEAEDIAQETLIKLWMIRDKLNMFRNLDSLVITITKNICISRFRKSKIILEGFHENMDVKTESNPHLDLEDSENNSWLGERIDGLPASQMTIMKMSQLDGMSNSDIARVLCISESSVRSALSRARKSLIEQLKNRK